MARVGDRAGAHPALSPRADLPGRGVEQRAAFGSVAIERVELLAVAALRDQRLLAVSAARLEPGEAVVGERQPVAALGVLALVDEVEAELALPGHDARDRLAQLRIGRRRVALGYGRLPACVVRIRVVLRFIRR